MKVTSSNEILGAIKMYMYMNNISQDELAHKIGKSKQTISAVFNTKNPSTNLLFEIVNVLDIPIICDVEAANKKSSSDTSL